MQLMAPAIWISIIAVIVRGQTISDKAAEFKAELDILFCDGLQVGGSNCAGTGVQEFLNSVSDDFDNEVEHVSSTIQQMIDRLDNALNVRASFLTNMSAAIRSKCSLYDAGEMDESMHTFEDLMFAGNQERAALLPSDIEYNAVYGDTVSMSATTYKLPNDVSYTGEHIQNDAKISMLIEETMLSLHEEHCVGDDGEILYCAMYFGSINGLFRQFPGGENVPTNGAYPNYDPRFRPWYVSAASGSKDVVILIDISGSMNTAGRMYLAQQAVVKVLQTLGPSSFVSVVAFSSDVELSCFGHELVAATDRNVAELIKFVESLSAQGSTNFRAAFETAFDILSQGGKSCRTSILFLTDGISDDPSDIIAARNVADINAVIFSYTLGSGADETIPRRVADATGGVYTHIQDDDANLITAMSSYYLYYAFGDAASNNDMIVTSPYLDFGTSVVMITMALPVYIDDLYFVGVVGIDLPLTLLSDSIGDVVIGRKSYSFIVNTEGEALIHPLIPNPLTTLFADGDSYNAVFIADLEPSEFDVALLTERENGYTKISATVKQSAGNVAYNGYVLEAADLLYFYAGVGPSSLSVGFVIFSEPDIAAPNVQGFGLTSSPSADCDPADTAPSNCAATNIMFHDLDVMIGCHDELSWVAGAGITPLNQVLEASWYLQPGGYGNPSEAVVGGMACEELDALHSLMNGLGSVSTADLPYGGFRDEMSTQIFNAIKVLPAMAQFWKAASSVTDADTVFDLLYFGSYHGLFVMYPTLYSMGTTFNPVIRPWYQRAVTYPQLFTLTTPYVDWVTRELVASGATALLAPNSNYPFGVIAFDFRFGVFITYWQETMGDICSGDDRCYLIDSSAFLLYYDGIEDDMEDEDISHKFFGDFEPTLMQSLLEKEFFVGEQNTNHLTDSIDIAYVANAVKIAEHDLDSLGSPFALNGGTYSVHQVTGTNLFVVHIADFVQQMLYPSDCPDEYCSLVQSPGCIVQNGECLSASANVCEEPDVPAESEAVQCTATGMNEDHMWILTQESDMCASNLLEMEENCAVDNTCGDEKDSGGAIGIAIAVIVVVSLVCIGFVLWCKCRSVRTNAARPSTPNTPKGRQQIPSDASSVYRGHRLVPDQSPGLAQKPMASVPYHQQYNQQPNQQYNQPGRGAMKPQQHPMFPPQNKIEMAALQQNRGPGVYPNAPPPPPPPPAYNGYKHSSAEEGSMTDY